MKLYFSTIRIALPNTEVLTYWESGHPDEYDVQELFARSARYHTVAELLTETAGPRAHTHMDRRELHMETTRGAQRAPFVRPGPLSVPG